MPKQQEKILEELQSIEAFAAMLLEKCYSVKQLLSPGGFHPRAPIKKKSQSKINQVILNRNKSLGKAKKILFVLLLFTTGMNAQNFSLPSFDSLCLYIDCYYNILIDAEIKEFQQSKKQHWLNYIPSPGYSPFTGGFTVSLNLTAPINEAKNRYQVNQKILSIKRINKLHAEQLKNEVYAEYKIIEISIAEYYLKDSLAKLKITAFNLFTTQYERHELTPSEFLNKQQEFQSFQIQRHTEANQIQKSIFQLLIKSKAAIATNYNGH